MPQPGQPPQDNTLDLLFMIGLVIFLVVIIWFFYGYKITSVGLSLKYYQLELWRWGAKFFIGGTKQLDAIDNMLNFIKLNASKGVDFKSFYEVLKFVGGYWRYLYTAISLGLVVLVWLKPSSPSNFHKHFNTQTLRQTEVVNWPQIAPVLKLDLVNTRLDEGPWAMALAPMEYCKKHNLLIVNKDDSGKYTVKLNRTSASKVLTEQLGPEWAGVNKIPIYMQALFAIFAARIAGDRKASENLLDSISRSALSDQLDFSGTEALLAKYAEHQEVQKIVSQHAYVTSVMASLLETARGLGVLATSEFIWLKPVDRRMWYMLNSVGRATAVAEICGAFGHWLAEKSHGGTLKMPMIDEAIKGLEIALTELVYKPDENDQN